MPLLFFLLLLPKKVHMIVCICNNVSDRTIRQAVDAGVRTMVELRTNLDVGTCCGKCHACAKRVLHDCLQQSAAHVAHQVPPMARAPVVFHRNAASA